MQQSWDDKGQNKTFTYEESKKELGSRLLIYCTLRTSNRICLPRNSALACQLRCALQLLDLGILGC